MGDEYKKYIQTAHGHMFQGQDVREGEEEDKDKYHYVDMKGKKYKIPFKGQEESENALPGAAKLAPGAKYWRQVYECYLDDTGHVWRRPVGERRPGIPRDLPGEDYRKVRAENARYQKKVEELNSRPRSGQSRGRPTSGDYGQGRGPAPGQRPAYDRTRPGAQGAVHGERQMAVREPGESSLHGAHGRYQPKVMRLGVLHDSPMSYGGGAMEVLGEVGPQGELYRMYLRPARGQQRAPMGHSRGGGAAAGPRPSAGGKRKLEPKRPLEEIEEDAAAEEEASAAPGDVKIDSAEEMGSVLKALKESTISAGDIHLSQKEGGDAAGGTEGLVEKLMISTADLRSSGGGSDASGRSARSEVDAYRNDPENQSFHKRFEGAVANVADSGASGGITTSGHLSEVKVTRQDVSKSGIAASQHGGSFKKSYTKSRDFESREDSPASTSAKGSKKQNMAASKKSDEGGKDSNASSASGGSGEFDRNRAGSFDSREDQESIKVSISGLTSSIKGSSSGRPGVPGIAASTIGLSEVCKSCYVQRVNAVILPCGHLAICYECGSKIKKCPLCGEAKGSVHKVSKSMA